MRKVFANSMVAHVWAQQSQPEGRAANGNFYFDGPVIYSYGSHFHIARFTDARLDGRCVVLFCPTSRSISTSRHQSYVSRALAGLGHAVISCDHVTGWNNGYRHDENVRAMVTDFNHRCAEMAKPRKRMYFGWSDADGRIEDTVEQRLACVQPPENLVQYVTAFGLAMPELSLETKRQAIRDAFAKHNDPKTVAKRKRDANKRMLKFAGVMASYHGWLEGVLAKPPALDSLPKATRRDAEYRLREISYSKLVGVTPEQWQAGKGDMTAMTQSWNPPNACPSRPEW